MHNQAINLAERIRIVKQSLQPETSENDTAPILQLLNVSSSFDHVDSQILESFISWAENCKIPAEYKQVPAPTAKEHFTEAMLQPDSLPGLGICREAEQWDADLIVLGYRREWELKKLVLGSVCNYVTHHAPCSVYVARSFNPFDVEEPELGKKTAKGVSPSFAQMNSSKVQS